MNCQKTHCLSIDICFLRWQDAGTAAVVGNSSYNELLARLTTADLTPAEPGPAAGVAPGSVAEAPAARPSAPAASSNEVRDLAHHPAVIAAEQLQSLHDMCQAQHTQARIRLLHSTRSAKTICACVLPQRGWTTRFCSMRELQLHSTPPRRLTERHAPRTSLQRRSTAVRSPLSATCAPPWRCPWGSSPHRTPASR